MNFLGHRSFKNTLLYIQLEEAIFKDEDKGFVSIEGGDLEVTAGDDGIQAETSVGIIGGEVRITSGGGSAGSTKIHRDNFGPRGMENTAVTETATPSFQGITAIKAITIAGGRITIDSADDCINSDGDVAINGGTITLASGDDSIHADNKLEINGGDISITKSYEGLESTAMVISDGRIHVAASDDGINVGSDSGAFPGAPGQAMAGLSSDNYLEVSGGYIYINAAGDGIDVNGQVNMSSGTVIVNGPTSNNNGALDHVSFKITGGFLLAVGSPGMAMAPGSASSQYSVLLNLEASQPANTMLHMESADGAQILIFIPVKAYQSVVLSSPGLKNGSTYTVYRGGSSSGTSIDGLIWDGKYTAGTQISSFTVSGMVTSIGSRSGGFRGGQGGMMPPPGGTLR